MQNAERIVADLKRGLNDELQKTETDIQSTQAAINGTQRQHAHLDEVAALISRHCQEISTAGARRILELTDHQDLAAVNPEQHFAGALVALLFFLFEKNLTAIVSDRVGGIWPADGIGAAERKQKLDELNETLAKLIETKAAIERQRRAVGIKPSVFVGR